MGMFGWLSRKQTDKNMPSDGPLVTEATEQIKTPEQAEQLIHAYVASKAKERKDHLAPNEDSLFVNAEQGTFGVFDGVGGQESGAVASRIASEYFRKHFYFSDNLTLQIVKKQVRRALEAANTAVFEAAKLKDNNMSTTAVVGKVWKGPDGQRKLIVGHVGDSRAYLWRAGQLRQLTLDHGPLTILRARDEKKAWRAQRAMSEMENPFAISQETAPKELKDLVAEIIYAQKNRHQLYESLGFPSHQFHPDISVVDLQPKDRILMMSDGIVDNLTDQEIADTLRQHPNERATNAFIEKASAKSQSNSPRRKPDDMTVILVDPFNSEMPRQEISGSKLEKKGRHELVKFIKVPIEKEISRLDLQHGDIIELTFRAQGGRPMKCVFEVNLEEIPGQPVLECISADAQELKGTKGPLLGNAIRKGAPVVYEERRTAPVESITLVRRQQEAA